METGKKSAKYKIKSWYSNRYQIVILQRNVLLALTATSIISVAIAVFFVKGLVSSKSLEPYVIEIEEKTGIPTIVKQRTLQEYAANESMTRYFVNKLVHAASGYDPRTYKMDSDTVRLLGSPAIYSDYKRRINPLELKNDSKIEVRIKSIQLPNPSVAQVRILKQTSGVNGTSQKDEFISISFQYADLTLSNEERLINPLGFQAVSYQITEEIFKY